MSDLRSRAAVFGLTTGAAVVLAVPVVAWGQVPGVDRVAGGVNRAAQDVVQGAPPVRLPVLPIQLPAAPPAPSAVPAAGGSHSAPETSAPAAPPPSASAPAGSAPAGSASAPAAAAPGAGATGSGSGGGFSGVSASASGAKRRGTPASSSHKAQAAQDSGSGPTDVEIADEAAEAPRDASPATLPFTGLRLALMLTAGLAVLATGAALRWTAR